MNITPSKLLLAISVAAYTYCTWDHLFPPKKPDPPAVKAIALTPAMVNHTSALSIGRDVFNSTLIDRGVGDAALPGEDDNSSSPGSDPASASSAISGAAAVADAMASQAALSGLTLQGVFMTPEGHAALINGTPVNEGEIATIGEGGPKILATQIGEDYAVIVCRGKTETLKLATTSAAGTGDGDASGNTTHTASSNPPAAAAHGNGWSDPYAGHRTVHH